MPYATVGLLQIKKNTICTNVTKKGMMKWPL